MKTIHVVHLVYRFSIGGLENVIVQLINGLPHNQFRHTVISLTDLDQEFVKRISRPDVNVIPLNKPPGQPFGLYIKVFRLLRKLRPDVFHSCNLAALEFSPVAAAAGVPKRIHAEHGWDVHDPNGSSVRYQRIRRFYRPFVTHYVAVSRDIYDYLRNKIRIPELAVSLIANGVDTELFSPASPLKAPPSECPFVPAQHWLVGTVGRMQTVKNQPFLARGFVRMLLDHPEARLRARLVIIGDGPLRHEVESILKHGGVSALAWLPGARSDVGTILRSLDCFVLPSETEGTSCTLQEAMAMGLPVIATAVGGTPQLVTPGITGTLLSPNDDQALANSLWDYFSVPDIAKKQGEEGRKIAVQNFSLRQMLPQYQELFSSN